MRGLRTVSLPARAPADGAKAAGAAPCLPGAPGAGLAHRPLPTSDSAAAEAAHTARIGPNAVLQTAAALRAMGGEALAARVFGGAGLGAHLDAPPASMVDERVVARLFDRLGEALAPEAAAAIARDSGRRTAAYILANRIPRPAQRVLRLLPRGPSARLLLMAIRKNGWTFAGSGRVATRAGRPCRIEIADNPIAVPGCVWHVAVFEGPFRALVSPGTTVRETACCARGAPACRFELRP
mgnify:CR=1 FL=1